MVVDNLPARSIIWFFPYVLIDLDKRKDSASVLSKAWKGIGCSP